MPFFECINFDFNSIFSEFNAKLSNKIKALSFFNLWILSSILFESSAVEFRKNWIDIKVNAIFFF